MAEYLRRDGSALFGCSSDDIDDGHCFVDGAHNEGGTLCSNNLFVDKNLTGTYVRPSLFVLDLEADELTLHTSDNVGKSSHHVGRAMNFEAEDSPSSQGSHDLLAQS